MCDTYGAPGSKTDIDIEELDKKGYDLISREFPKPTLDDIYYLKPLINIILDADGVISKKNLDIFTRQYKFNGKRSFLLNVYLELLLLKEVSNKNEKQLRLTLQIKPVKSHSGICSITIFTDPYPEYTDDSGVRIKQAFSCEFNCSFCPTQPSIPKSYVLNEPAVLRAVKNKFDCIAQMHDRMNALYMIGHPDLNKLEINVLGGTWTSYPKEYREEFVSEIYYAANIFWDNLPRRLRLSLNDEKKINEKARSRIVLLAIELRPDSITIDEIKFLRYLSVTRIQMGIQHTDDEILRKINRKCPTYKTIEAIKMLKQVGYKIDGHFMPNLPFSDPIKDRVMLVDNLVGLKERIKRETKGKITFLQRLMGIEEKLEYWEYYDLVDKDIQVDQLKIYPTAVTIYTEIEEWYKKGSYIPYDEKYLIDIMIDFKTVVFPWLRINRIMRDFFADNIYSISGSNLNMRCQLVDIMKKEGKKCNCIRCRENKNKSWDGSYIIVIRLYRASDGDEYFISAESDDNNILYGFVRLRLDDAKNKIFPELNGCALLREAHVFSSVTSIGEVGNIQHKGLGTILMNKAVEISKSKNYKKLAVIASVGSRTFYEKIGYKLDPGLGEYMIKTIN